MTDDGLDALLAYLKGTRGFDFSGYKRPSLARRIDRRMVAVGASDYAAYQDRLEVDADEFARLFDTILINVTGFFRDPAAWEHLRRAVLPDLLEARGPDAMLRVWVAGCASGEEAYTVAALLCEALGPDGLRRRVKIYATDADEDALAIARRAEYDAAVTEAVPAELRELLFEGDGARVTVRTTLRRVVVFGRNDLVQDAPIARIDLLCCRNTLMYLNAETQAQVLRRFHFALRDRGVLFAGRSELLGAHRTLFAPVSAPHRMFAKVPLDRPALALAHDAGNDVADGDAVAELRHRALDALAAGVLLVDLTGVLVAANQPARVLFGLSASDIGRPLQDLEVSYRPVELRSPIERAIADRRTPPPVETTWVVDGAERCFSVCVTPVGADGSPLGVAVLFEDVSDARATSRDLERTRADLQTAYEELQSTVEELETTNEELQSSNEELETTNEELQSTVEELETINEELQATNDELELTNTEARLRSEDLDQVNEVLETVLAELGAGIALVDDAQRVRIWNATAEDLWGIRPDEALGQPLVALDIGLPLTDVVRAVTAALDGGPPGARMTLPARDRRGRDLQCRVTVLAVGTGSPRRAIVLMRADATGG